MCKIDPNNIGMLRNFASVLLLVVFFSIITGKTYFKRIIARTDEPTSFWATVLMYFLLGMMIGIGTYVCR